VTVPPFDPTQAFGGELYDKATNTWSPKPGVTPAQKAPHFDGTTYDPPKDHKRLTKQLERVYEVVKAGKWYTLAEISAITGDPEGSISARLRDLRKSKFGSHDIRKKREGNTFSYTCLPPQETEDNQQQLF
jgi:hypothetical protein